MSSQALRDARRYEEVYEKMILPEERPAFHLSSRVGWMRSIREDDPAGGETGFSLVVPRRVDERSQWFFMV